MTINGRYFSQLPAVVQRVVSPTATQARQGINSAASSSSQQERSPADEAIRATRDRARSEARLGLTPFCRSSGAGQVPDDPASRSMQKRTKITVVDRLPEGVKVKDVGYHGSTGPNFNKMAREGVNFSRTGTNFGGYSALGPGLYVTPNKENAYAYALQAARIESGSGRQVEAEVASVYLAQPAKGFIQRQVPFDFEPADAARYRESVRDAHQLNVDFNETIITPRAAESNDVNYYVVRDGRE